MGSASPRDAERDPKAVTPVLAQGCGPSMARHRGRSHRDRGGGERVTAFHRSPGTVERAACLGCTGLGTWLERGCAGA